MKIVSKDSVEVQHAVKPAKTRHRTSYEGKPSKPSIVISDAKDPVAQRKAHLAREKRRREAIRNKKKAGKQKEVTKSRDEPTYFRSKYDEFISLIRFNITFKLSIGYALRLISLLLFLFVSIYFAFSYYLYYSCRESLSANSDFVQEYISASGIDSIDQLEPFANSENIEIFIFDEGQSLVYSSSNRVIEYEEATTYSKYDFRTFPGFQNLYEYRLITLPTGEIRMVSIIKNMIPSRNIIEATFPIGFVLGFVLILSSIASASKMASKHLKPIHMLTEQVKDMSANNLSTRLNLSGTKDELKDLAYTFNKMLDDIQKSYEREKQFVSDASHELRTPIAVIKGYAGMLNRWGKDDPEILEESIQAIMGESENMQSLVESLLFIARNDKGSLKMDLAEFDISDLLKEIVKETRMIDTHHQITDTIDDGLKVYGSADKLKQAFRIFIDNSIKYTLENGKIDIRLKSSEKHVILVIEDNGIGISDEDLPHIFDRFYRADKSRTKMKENQHGGTGLGLSIAKIIVEQHKGRIQVESALNQGTKFTLVIPKFVPESPELKESL